MISQVQPWLDESEVGAVVDAINSNWVTEGPYCSKAQDMLKDLLGTDYVTFAPNGTLGLYLALVALDLPKGSEVIVPDFTFFGSCSSIVMAGLVPVVADIDPKTFQIDLNDLKNKITANTSAIMPVHVYGHGQSICEIVQLAKASGLRVVEDAAQVLGVNFSQQSANTSDGSCGAANCCRVAKQHLGTFGDVGVFSLYADKTITAGEGGIICTNDESIFEKIKLIRNQGRPNSGTFIHPAVGMNFRITDLQGAILSKQLEKLPEIIRQRQEVYETYTHYFSSLPVKFMEVSKSSEFIPFRFPFLTAKIESVLRTLGENSVQARRFFYPMHLQPALTEYGLDDCPYSKSLYDSGVCLPVHRGIGEAEIKHMSAIVSSAL
jgi:perosamine synthetase